AVLSRRHVERVQRRVGGPEVVRVEGRGHDLPGLAELRRGAHVARDREVVGTEEGVDARRRGRRVEEVDDRLWPAERDGRSCRGGSVWTAAVSAKSRSGSTNAGSTSSSETSSSGRRCSIAVRRTIRQTQPSSDPWPEY